MENTITYVQAPPPSFPLKYVRKPLLPQDLRIEQRKDTLDLGDHEAVTNGQAMSIVLDRTYEQLKSVVGDARKALGIPENVLVDTSPEATATRIADFALGAYEQWRGNHADLAEADAKNQFAEFIGGAIDQGIEEAKGILTSLNALNDSVSQDIDTTRGLIQTRLEDFIASVT
ncbi:MAG: hypothetical protein QG656_1707 [Candidatus Hydrogenedentes bacterium]|nr:hypothetical protein [Candidatus Hydrogenedentota bacterium]